MRLTEVNVRAKSVYAEDKFAVTIVDGRPQIVHEPASGPRGPLVAVFASATDRLGALRVEILSRAMINKIFAERRLGELDLSREAEGHACRRMGNHLIGGVAAATA